MLYVNAQHWQLKMKGFRIDVHTHILPRELPDLKQRYGRGDKWIKMQHTEDCCCSLYKGSKFFRKIEQNCFSASHRISDCDANGITVQVLSTLPAMFNYDADPEDCADLCKYLNDDINAVCIQNPTRFLGLGTLPMQSPGMAVEELKRMMTLSHMVGIQIGTHVNQLPLGDPALFPIFEACEKLDACVFVHPWDMAGEEIMQKYWLPWLVGMPAETSFAICSLMFSGIFVKLPKLRVCFAHGGGSFSGTFGRIEHGFQCRPDLVACDCNVSPREQLGSFYVDSLTHDIDALLSVKKLVGSKRVCLGTDYPFPLGENEPGRMIDDGIIDEEEKERMLWKNSIGFLGTKAGFLLQEYTK
jgi:aminocarboxymuconate-semialdehyde decarboxylase